MSNQTIIKRLQILKDLTAELNVLKEQYSDALENDPSYQETQGKITELKQGVKEKNEEVKTTILERNTFKNLKTDIKEKQEEIKANKEVLSHELVEYYRTTGSPEIEDLEGNLKRMKFSVTLTS